MAQSQFAAPLIDQTVNAFNGDVTAVSPLDGVSLINHWVSALHTDTSSPLVANLQDLIQQLQSGTPDSSRIQSILEELASQTQQAADSADEMSQRGPLSELATAIRGFSEQLSGQRGPAHTGGNATAGPTVGGISSNENRSTDQTDISDSKSGAAYGTSQGTMSESTYDQTPDANTQNRIPGKGISGGESDENTGDSGTGRSGLSV